jgi:trimeric autotransporter adhesin
MNGTRYSRFFNFLLSFSLLVAPLPLPILAHDIMLIENFEDFYVDDYSLTSFIYLGRDLSPLADFIVTVSFLDNDTNSPLHQLKAHIEKGFLIAEQYAVAQALYHAEIILQKNYQQLDQSHARQLYDDLEEIAQKILSGMLKRSYTNIAVVNGLLSVNDQLVQNITAVDLSVTDAIMMAGTINMLTQNEVRFQDSAGGQYVGINAQSVVPTSYTLSLPTTVPTGNQVLRANDTTPTNLEWVTEGGSVTPANSKTIYVTKYGSDITGDGSFATPYASLSKAITTANIIASAINPICILVSAGIYIENNSSGPLAITANGISIVGESAASVIIMPNTPANNLLTAGNTIRIADITFQSSSPLATGLALTAGTLTVLNNVRVFNFLIGVDCSGGATQTYGFTTCFFVNNSTALNVSSTRVECNNCTIFGTSVITGPAANTGMNITGAASSVVFTGGVIGLCITGANITSNSTVTLSSVSCRLNAFDIVQNGASHLTLSGCTFELTDSASDIDIQVSGAGTIAEIIACEFSGASVSGTTEGTSIVVSSDGTANITGGVMHNYTTGMQVGTSLDTSSTELTASGLIIRNCTTDIDQQGSSTLLFNSSTASSSAIIINDPTYVELAFFDLDDNSALTIGSTANQNTTLVQAAIAPTNHPGFNYKSSLYSTEAMGFENIYGSPTSLYSLSPNDTDLTSVTTDRTKIAGVRLVSDEGSPVGGTSALRGWDINKNATSAELSFNYQNSDIVGQSAIAEYTVMQLDGVNSLLNLPAPGTQIVFDGDTNLYRSAANVLKTDDNFIVGTLTPDRVVVTAPVTNQLASSIVTGTELGYLSGVTSSVQTQINSKVAKAGDTMTGTLQLPAGTTALPSLVFTGSTTTGLSATSGALSFSTNAVEAFKISALGVVTIDGLAGTAGVVHNDSSGNLSSSLIVNADIAAGANISDSKLAMITTAGKVANSATSATSADDASTIVLRDGSGDFSAGTITANLIGNATTATTATNVSGSLSGDVTGTQSATVVSFVGGQSAANVAAATVLANAATSVNTASTIVKRTVSGDFSAGAISVTDTVISNSATITPFSTAGVVHNDASGLLSSSLIVNADITNATISNAKLATINSANITGAIVVRDGSGNFATNMITLAGTTTNATDAATKAYVDAAVSTGLVAKAPAVVVSLTNETISGPATIDDVVLTDGDRVLLTGQTDPIENGLWVVNTSGAWTRPADFANGSTAGQAYVLILSGTLYAGSSWLCNTPTAVVGTNPIGFALFSLPDSTTGANVGVGTGLIFKNKTGSNINFKTLIEGSHLVITNNTDDITLATDATDANTASTIVARDGSGNFSAGTITAALSGNATTATTATNFSGSLSGDVTGTQGATVVSFVGGQTAANVAAATTLANSGTSANTVNTIVKRDGSGNFSAGTITANLIGTVTGSASLNVLKAGDTMTGTLIMPAGSAASPSIKFSGSTNTGLSAATANTLSFDTNGVERLNIDSSGNVTIDGFTTVGVVHNDAAGLLTSSLIVDADITPGTISNASLATVSSANNANYIVTRDGSGNFSAGTITADLNGNATTATTATTATNFSGSLSGDVTGTQSATVVSFVGGQTAANVAAATVLANAATSANTFGTIVRRDASGNFNATTVIASLTGAASLNVLKAGDTMTGTLQLPAGTTAAPSLVFTGSTTAGLSATSGALSFSTNALERMKIASGGTISVDAFTSAGVVHNDASGNLSSSLIVNADITPATITGASIANATIANANLATISNTNVAGNIVVRDGSGNFSAGTITANLNGNATTATTATNFSGSLAGEVTGPQSATVVTNAVSANTASAIVRRTASGDFSAGTISMTDGVLSGNLVLTTEPSTSTAGNILKGSSSFIHDFGTNNIFVGLNAGNFTTSGSGGNSGFGVSALTANTTGACNTAVGSNALTSNTDGSNNTAVGCNALAANTDNEMTAVGSGALQNFINAGGGQSVAVGYNALNQNVDGFSNTAVGWNALASDVTSASGSNTAIGDQSLTSNITGTGNTAVGGSSLYANTIGSSNTAVGFEVMSGAIDPDDDTAFGYQALQNDTSAGGANVAIGYQALQANTSGSTNIAVGYQAMLNAIDASQDTAVGYQALQNDTIDGGGNVAVGYKTLQANTSGIDNTAVGYQASQMNVDGSSNTALGSQAASANISGGQITAVGAFALANNQAGDNTAIGTSALTNNTDGARNTAAGVGSLQNNTTGQENVAIGLDALLNNSIGSNNVAVGRTALAQSTGNNNIGIGDATGEALTSGNNNIYIGSDDSSATESNTIRIGYYNAGLPVQTSCYMQGIYNVTPGGGVQTVTINSSGQLGSTTSLPSGTSSNTPNTLVLRDGSGNFSAGTITASLSGNATTATTATNFSGSLAGDVTGTQSATVVSSVGGQTAANVAAATVLANAATSANTASAIVRRDGSGNFSAGTITASLTGAASLNVLKAGDTMTGTLTHPAGTAAAPSVQFTGSTNTGLSAPAANTLALSTNSAQRIGISAAGAVTINAFGTAGIVHNSAAGLLSTSLIVDADITNTTISNAKLAAISSANTANNIVVRDGSGNFSAGTITATLNGNATTATTATSATNFSGSLAGEVTGTQGATVVTNAVSANTASAIVRRDGSGNFSAGTITLGGNLAFSAAISTSTTGNITKGGNAYMHNFGTQNTFMGLAAGNFTTSGSGNNVGIGTQSLLALTTGTQNVAVGSTSLRNNQSGSSNIAIGFQSLNNIVTGQQNVAVGNSALGATTGSGNVGIGTGAGNLLGAGSNNIYIINAGSNADSGVIRIGSAGTQTSCFVAGITAVNVGAQPAVLVNGSGQLGVNTSTRKVKHAIEDMNDESADILKLRPVTFVYNGDETDTKQYGLIAEEVDEIFPGIVARDAEGEVQTVLYNVLPVLLLNEMKKQQVTIGELKNDNTQRDILIQNLMERVKALEARV